MPGSHVGCNCKRKLYCKCKDLHVNYPNAISNASDNAKNENTFIFFGLHLHLSSLPTLVNRGN